MTTQTRIGLALQIDQFEGGAIRRAVIPVSVFTLLIALTGLFMPSLMGLAVAIYGAAMLILAGLTWLYVQITAGVIIAKIVLDCLLWFYQGGENYDYYN